MLNSIAVLCKMILNNTPEFIIYKYRSKIILPTDSMSNFFLICSNNAFLHKHFVFFIQTNAILAKGKTIRVGYVILR